MAIADFPKLAGTIPSAACLLDLLLQTAFVQANADTDERFGRTTGQAGRIRRFFDDEFDGLVALAALIVITIPDTDKLRAVLFDQFLGAGLSGLPNQACPQHCATSLRKSYCRCS